MNGRVNENGRALTFTIFPSPKSSARDVEAWIDTAFTGDLAMPQRQIDDLALPHSGTAKAILADGSDVVLKTHACEIEWCGAKRHLEVVANEGNFPHWVARRAEPAYQLSVRRDHDRRVARRLGQ